MLKHLDDKGDLNLFLEDDGSMLVVCSKCKKIWSGRLELNVVTDATNTTDRHNVGRMLATLRTDNTLMMKEIGLDKITGFELE